MEYQFDLLSFVLGGAAAILGLEMARLAGFVAGNIHARIEHRLSPLESIGSISTASARIAS